MTTEQKIQYIADHYGYEPQSRQLIEEMAELTVAINKLWRVKKGYCDKPEIVARLNIIEEMADVMIMLWQMEYLLGMDENELERFMDEKLDREIERIKNK